MVTAVDVAPVESTSVATVMAIVAVGLLVLPDVDPAARVHRGDVIAVSLRLLVEGRGDVLQVHVLVAR